MQFALDMDDLVYRKWGGAQRARAGDWLVDNDGDVYTVAAESFAQTYSPVDAVGKPGAFVKHTPIWAVEAAEAGTVATKEGVTHYAAGDFIVSNQPDGEDSYAITRARFEDLYEPATDD